MIKRHDVELLAEMACRIDDLKNRFPERGHQIFLARAVADLHYVAGKIDAQYRLGLYEGEAA